ncbi:hypothetical protein CPter91_3323 [Collimonas pratensis]|uniref:Uncharacterized protein n=1 Tax=Collimonas pratensis TaxID=279113 RepID=A0A127Q6E3_9BURK|nr:hypothetical protein CPter91_3323 [Collimonas pratensis]
MMTANGKNLCQTCCHGCLPMATVEKSARTFLPIQRPMLAGARSKPLNAINRCTNWKTKQP